MANCVPIPGSLESGMVDCDELVHCDQAPMMQTMNPGKAEQGPVKPNCESEMESLIYKGSLAVNGC